jgi:hypothetical protein
MVREKDRNENNTRESVPSRAETRVDSGTPPELGLIHVEDSDVPRTEH